jgi:hypothetical protein
MEEPMAEQHLVKVAEWSQTPGARYRSDGPHSGEEFREEVLKPAFLRALQERVQLTVDLDGGYGYAAGFLEEVFGGLARQYDSDTVARTVVVVTKEEPYLEQDIREYIAEARRD